MNSPIVSDLILKELVALGVALFLIAVIASIMIKSLVKAAEYPPPATLVVALSVLTLLSIAGGITTDNDEAWAIAAAGIGALAGSVSSVYKDTTKFFNSEEQVEIEEKKEQEDG